MAAPVRHNASSFAHTADMRNDRRIAALRMRHGLPGYAVYCMLLEVLTDSDGFELAWDAQGVADLSVELAIDPAQLTDMVEDCMAGALGLLRIEAGRLSSPELTQSMQALLSRRERKRSRYREANTAASAGTDSDGRNDVTTGRNEVTQGRNTISDGQNPVSDSRNQVTDIRNPHSTVRNAEGRQTPAPLIPPLVPPSDSPLRSPPIIPPTPARGARSGKRDTGADERAEAKRQTVALIRGREPSELMELIGQGRIHPLQARIVADGLENVIERIPRFLTVREAEALCSRHPPELVIQMARELDNYLENHPNRKPYTSLRATLDTWCTRHATQTNRFRNTP